MALQDKCLDAGARGDKRGDMAPIGRQIRPSDPALVRRGPGSNSTQALRRGRGNDDMLAPCSLRYSPRDRTSHDIVGLMRARQQKRDLLSQSAASVA